MRHKILINPFLVLRGILYISAYDAGGQQGSGINDGNLNYLGNLEQCMRVKATGEVFNITIKTPWPNPDYEEERIHDFDFHYCRIYWPLLPNVSIKELCSMKDK